MSKHGDYLDSPRQALRRRRGDSVTIAGFQLSRHESNMVSAASGIRPRSLRELLWCLAPGLILMIIGWWLTAHFSPTSTIVINSKTVFSLTLFGVGVVLFVIRARQLDRTDRTRKLNAMRRIGYPLCVNCEYNLSGLGEAHQNEGRCPECAADLSTMSRMNTARAPSRVDDETARERVHERWLILPERLVWVALALFVLLIVVGLFFEHRLVQRVSSPIGLAILMTATLLLPVGIIVTYGRLRERRDRQIRRELCRAGYRICITCGYIMDDPTEEGERQSNRCPVCRKRNRTDE